MAIKNFEIDGIGSIRVQKRRGARSMRIKLAQDGTVTVGIPYWVPYRVALDYAKKQTNWINQHRPQKRHLVQGQKIGRNHTLNYVIHSTSKPKVQNKDYVVNILMPKHLEISEPSVQKAAIRGARGALVNQSHILENEIKEHAERLGYRFNSLSYKFMRSKWGSCNSNKHITLNYRLLDLPEHLAEYVMIHELVHLNHMNHSKSYWDELSNLLPDYKIRRNELKKIQLDW